MGCGPSSPAKPRGDDGAPTAASLLPDPEHARKNAVVTKPTASFNLGSSGYVLRYACLSQRGYNPKDLYEENKDAFRVVENFCDDSSEILFGVFNGHGEEGVECAKFAKREFSGALQQAASSQRHGGSGSSLDATAACKQAMLALNRQLHETDECNAAYSGTTALIAWFNQRSVHVCNVGDSRAVLGERRGKRVVPYALSVDHTPYRKDERERLKAAGAVIQSETMANLGLKGGDVEWEENVDKAEFMQRTSSAQRRSSLDHNTRNSLLGIGSNDPLDLQSANLINGYGVEAPRVYQKGRPVPGMKVTRSLGDDIWEARVGITASAEVLKKSLVEADQFIMIATDGLWEFVSNQAVCEMVTQFSDPLDACHAVLAEAYSLWLQFEVQTDDITMILAYVDVPEGPAPRKAPEAELTRFAEIERTGRRLSTVTSLSPASTNSWTSRASLSFDDVAREGMRPVRRGLSPAKRAQLAISAPDALASVGSVAGVEEPSPAPTMADAATVSRAGKRRASLVLEVPKSLDEVARISAALSANFLFERLGSDKIHQLALAMKRRETKEDELIFCEGERGDKLYVVEQGEFVASVKKEDDDRTMDLYEYEVNEPHGANPCFGELALMHAAPREYTVKSLGEGVLWEVERRTYQKVLLFSSRAALLNTLRSVEVFRSLAVQQVEQLADALVEVVYQPGDVVLKQGDVGTTFYVISNGRCRIARSSALNVDQHLVDLGPGEYFGERALLENEPRAATVTAAGKSPLKVLTISKAVFDQVLGPLQLSINEYAAWRYRMAGVKEFERNAAGLFGVQVSDFALEGATAEGKPFKYLLGVLGARSFTIKCAAKSELVSQKMVDRVRREIDLLDCVMHHRRFVPLPLVTLEENQCMFAILPCRLTLSLAQVLESSKGVLDERSALFYTACLVLALEHLHNEHSTYAGGVVYRNLSPDHLYLDEHGYVQLCDFRYATKADPPPRDYCGYAHYLSPEQVAGGGHGTAADFWGLGVLLYELTTGSNPWLNLEDDSTVQVYNRIASHMSDTLPLPETVTLSAFVVKLLNELFEPLPGARLGARDPEGVDELKAHPAFERIQWRDLAEGVVHAPHIALVESHADGIQKKAAATADGHLPLTDLFPQFAPKRLLLPTSAGSAAAQKLVEDMPSSPQVLATGLERSTEADPVRGGGVDDEEGVEDEDGDTVPEMAGPKARSGAAPAAAPQVADVMDSFRGFMDGFSRRFMTTAPDAAPAAVEKHAVSQSSANGSDLNYGNAFSTRPAGAAGGVAAGAAGGAAAGGAAASSTPPMAASRGGPPPLMAWSNTGSETEFI